MITIIKHDQDQSANPIPRCYQTIHMQVADMLVQRTLFTDKSASIWSMCQILASICVRLNIIPSRLFLARTFTKANVRSALQHLTDLQNTKGRRRNFPRPAIKFHVSSRNLLHICPRIVSDVERQTAGRLSWRSTREKHWPVPASAHETNCNIKYWYSRILCVIWYLALSS